MRPYRNLHLLNSPELRIVSCDKRIMIHAWILYGLLIIFTIFFNAFTAPVQAQVFLTEIMFNPSGNENYNEFVEIYNAGDVEVDVSGWSISDSAAADKIISAGSGTVLGPGQFGIILDPGYFGNSTEYDSLIPPEALILTIDGSTFGSRGLSNSKPEPVMLITTQQDTLSRYIYSINNKDGFSEEKILLRGPDSRENWGDSRRILGTPGTTNSLSPLKYDLQLSSLQLRPEYLTEGQSVAVYIVIQNAGEFPPDDASLYVYHDRNRDKQGSADELLIEHEIVVSRIQQYRDSLEVEFDWTPAMPGDYLLLAVIEAVPDNDPGNNALESELGVLSAEPGVIINEIMFYPLENTPEWIELYNSGKETVSLRDWLLFDEKSENGIALTKGSVSIPSEGFIVLTGDSAALSRTFFYSFSILQVEGFPQLNNSGDIVRIVDPAGRTADEAHYDDSMGINRGSSFERISFRLPGTVKSNWGLSKAPEGGTPGRENSLQPADPSMAATVTAEPNPFSPSSGHELFCTITVSLPFTESHVTVKIFDRLGRLVRNLVQGEPRGSRFSLQWDGKNNSGAMMSTDVYIIFLNALSSQAGKSITHKSTVILVNLL